MRRTPTRSTPTIEREAERSGTLSADEQAAVAPQFRPLDPGIVSEAIPAFFIGPNKEGFWVARDAPGANGWNFPARELRTVVWSPEQIAGWLKRTYPGKPQKQVSHETIYRSLFIQARGVLKKELLEHLRARHGPPIQAVPVANLLAGG